MTNMRVGDEISFQFGLYNMLRHVGICVDFHPLTSEPMIAHNSERFGGVRISPLSEFAEGRAIRTRRPNSPTNRRDIGRTIAALIDRPYDVVSFNCEHFTSMLLGNRAHSPQLLFWLSVGLLGGAALLSASSKR